MSAIKKNFIFASFKLLFYYNLLIFLATVKNDRIFDKKPTYAITRIENIF